MASAKKVGEACGIALALLIAALDPQPAVGVELRSGENVTVKAEETIRDDLYMTGDTMTVVGRVIGDVVAAGRLITIEGVVQGDLIAAAQAIVVRGQVTDDVRIAGMSMQLGPAADIGDDVFAAGFSFASEAGSQVTGKTGLTGFQAMLGGQHQQGLEASLVGLRIEGRVGGDVDVSVESEAGVAWWTRFMRSPVPLPVVQPGLEVADGARVEGRVRYTSTAPAEIGSLAAVVGGLEQIEPQRSPEPVETFFGRLLTAARWLIVLLLFGVVLLWLFPDMMVGVGDILEARPLAGVGWGFVTLIGVAVGLLLILVLTAVLSMAFGMVSLTPAVSAIVVLGILAVVMLAGMLWVTLFYVAPVVVSFAGGRRLMKQMGQGPADRRYLSMLLGLFLLTCLILLPIVGAIGKAVVMILGLGGGALWAVRYLAAGEG